MASDLLSEIYEEHQRLLDGIEEDETKTSIPDIREFLARIGDAGGFIPDPRQRSQLRALMRFWGSFIYERIGEFPDIPLLPATEIEESAYSDDELDRAFDEIVKEFSEDITEYVPSVDRTSKPLEALEKLLQEAKEKPTRKQMPKAGSRFGIYELLDEIGGGGFSTVFKAIDIEADRLVALKIIHSEQFERTKRFQERFIEREKLIGTLDHPCIVPVYEVGETEGIPYIAMKYVESGSLADRLSDWFWRPTIREILGIAFQVVDGLEYLYSQEIVHRDIKPANILLDFDNRVYLTDFGIAQVVEAAFQGMIVGTPEYLAPEAILEPEEVDVRADIYSLGIILFALLEGRVPFQAETSVQVMYQQVNDDVPALAEDLPESLRNFVISCLSKAPEDRGGTSEVKEKIDILLESLQEEVLDLQPAPFVKPPETRTRWKKHETRQLVFETEEEESHPTSTDSPRTPQQEPSSYVPLVNCAYCGTRLKPRSHYCNTCGNKVEPVKADYDTQVLENGHLLITKGIFAILIGDSPDKYYVMDQNRMTLGRSPHNNIVLEHPTVSRQHALINYCKLEEEDEGTFTLYDLASANGVLVNGEPCIKQQLEHNDVITLGEVELTFKRLDQ